MNKSLRFLVVLPVLLLTLSGCNFSLADDITPPPGYRPPTAAPTLGPVFPSAAPDPAGGEAIYAEKCAPCHGPTGLGDGEQGQALPVRVAAIGLPEVARPAVPADWYAVVSQGNIERFMPPFQSLSEQQRWDVLAYVHSLGTSGEQLEWGRALYEEHCASCHAPDGRGVENVRFTDQALMARLSDQNLFDVIGMGVEPSMPAYADRVDEEGRWALTAYVRRLSFAAPRPAPEAEQPTPTPGSVSAVDPAPTAAMIETPATPEGIGSVRGTARNGSGGAIPAGLTVTLAAFAHDPATGGFDPVAELTAPVATDGSYVFENVELPAERAFLVTLEYEGVRYNSQPAMAVAGMSDLTIDLTFYETSSDISSLNVSRWHIFVNFLPDGQSIQVIELIIVGNTSMRTVAPGEDDVPLLNYPLPAGAENVQFDDSGLPGRFVLSEGSFGDLAPILPGMEQNQVVLIYSLPYANRLALTRSLPLGADAVLVMAPQGVRVKSDFLVQGEPRDFQGTVFEVYDGRALPAQGQLSFTISGRPGGVSAISGWSGIPLEILIGAALLGLALIAASIFLYMRDRRQVQALADGPGEAEFEDTESILDAIIAVDDLHRAGKISEEAYRQRRAELKARLKELMGE